MATVTLRVDDNIIEAVQAWIKFGLPAGSCTSLLLSGQYDEAFLHAHELIKPHWQDHISYIETISAECRGDNMAAWSEFKKRQLELHGRMCNGVDPHRQPGTTKTVSWKLLPCKTLANSLLVEHVRDGIWFRLLDKKGDGVGTRLSIDSADDLADFLERKVHQGAVAALEHAVFDAHPLALCCLDNCGTSGLCSLACHYSIDDRRDLSEVLLDEVNREKLVEVLRTCAALERNAPTGPAFGLN